MQTQEEAQRANNVAAMNEVHAAALRAQVEAETRQAVVGAAQDIGHNALVAAQVEAPAKQPMDVKEIEAAMAVHSGYGETNRRA